MRLREFQITKLNLALAPFAPAVVYVFGSYGTSSCHPQSDMDVAFLPTCKTEAYQLFQIANALSAEFGTEVDLIDLSRASTVFRKEVIRTGETIHVQDELAKREFEMRTLSDYARLNEERREILAAC